MEELLRAAMLAYPALAALVGDRVVWLQRPQGARLPSVTLQLVSGPRDYTLRSRVGQVPYMVQMDAWGSTYASMKATARAITGTPDIEGFLDTLTAKPLQAFLENETEGFEAGDAADALGHTDFFRTRLDVRVVYSSAA